MSTRVLAIGLVVAGFGLTQAVGCGDDDAADAKTPVVMAGPGKAQADADAQADPADETIEIVAEPEPLALGLTLEATGSRAKVLPVADKATPRPLVVVFSATSPTKGKKSRSLRFPTVQLTLTSLAHSPSGRQLKIESVSLGDGAGLAEGTAAKMAKTMPPATVTLTSDAMQSVTSLDWPPSLEDPAAAELASIARHALSHLALPVPSEAVGPGAKWTLRREVQLFGLDAIQTLQTTLLDVQGGQVGIKATVGYTLNAEAPAKAALGLAAVNALQGSGTLTARVDLATGTPIEAHLKGRLEFTAADGTKKKVNIDARIDEDYLATTDARVKLSGHFTEGGLVHGQVPPKTKVWFHRKPVRTSPAGDFLIAFSRDTPSRALLSFQFAGGAKERHVVRVEDRQFEPEAIDGLPEAMVKLDRQTKVALAKSRKRIGRVREKFTKDTYFRDGWRWPMRGKITSTYGRKRILNGVDKGYHWGVDIAAPVGKKVRAPAPGVIVFAETKVPLSGTLLIMDHGHGLTSSFLHLKRTKVRVGDVVKAGQVIAEAGNTGRTTGPHLDWRMNLKGTRIDPLLLLSRK